MDDVPIIDRVTDVPNGIDHWFRGPTMLAPGRPPFFSSCSEDRANESRSVEG